MIETIFSVDSDMSWPDRLARLAQGQRRQPFDPRAIDFIAGISSRILRSSLARRQPELATLAHWFRRANLRTLAEKIGGGDGAVRVRVRARGLVFVIAPANVEVLFIYGWLLSLLAGNATIVRVSQKPNASRHAFLEVVHDLATDQAFLPVLADSWLITYPHDDAITGRISSRCDARLVWGGDATVSQIRSIALKPLAVEAVFADRFSFAVFSAATVCTEDETRLREIARRFVNDTLWFGQQACSSPRAVVWVGDTAGADVARRRFWPLYKAAAAAFENEPAALMSRVADLFMLAGVGAIDRLADGLSAFPGRADGRNTLGPVREIHSGCGMLVEYVVPSIQEVAPLTDAKDQTLVVYGLSDQAIEALLNSLPGRAVDRIVLPGEATNFSIVWDGADLLDTFTRKVNVTRNRSAAAY
jgi:hypothetical protein